MIFHDNDIDFLLSTVREAGATDILPRFRNLEAGAIAEKASSIDLVTEADLAAERRITAALRARFPDALVVGEEAYAEDPSVIDGLAEAPLAFVIDPVDGTFNFAAGLPAFGTLLAVTVAGETVAGIVHDPALGDTLVAVRGAGAQMRRAKGAVTPIKVATPVDLSEMVGIFSWGALEGVRRVEVASNMAKVKMALSLNCSAHEYWLASTGKVHFIGHQKLMPWDHLAGVLVHQEAGGYTMRHDGSPYLPGRTTGGILSAPDKDSWMMIRREILALC